MLRLRGRKYRFNANALNFANYAVFAAAAMLVLISAHAKTARSHADGGSGDDAALLGDGGLLVEVEETPVVPSPAPATAMPPELATVERHQHHQQEHQHHQQMHHSDDGSQQLEQPHHQTQPHKHQQPHHHHQQRQHQTPRQSNADDGLLPRRKHHGRKHHSQQLAGGSAANQEDASVSAHRRHSKFSIEELLHRKFERKTSNDIDMDPCKAGGFMGDIALPDFETGDVPLVGFTRTYNADLDEEESASAGVEAGGHWQADAPAPDGGDGVALLQFNATFQQELERLKQEVYHEGLQVEEEGLTEIIRKKTKLPSGGGGGGVGGGAGSSVEGLSERHRNDAALLSTNEPVKPTGYSMQHDYLLKNLKNEIIAAPTALHQQQQQQQQQQHSQQMRRKDNAAETEYFEPKVSLREKQAINVIVDGGAGGEGDSAPPAQGKLPVVGSNGSGGGDKDTIAQLALEQSAAAVAAAAAAEEEALQKLNKSTTAARLANRNVDQRRIQSNTKDIEVDSGNNFVAERKVVILPPTSLPATQRSTLPNVYSNAGGNGMKLDDVEFLHADGVVRRRHRRGRKNRRSSDSRSDYAARIQRLRDELNRPVRTMQDYRYVDGAHNHNNNNNNKSNTNSRRQQRKGRRQYDPYALGQTPVGASASFNYSAEVTDELEVLTKRKATMDAMNVEMQHSSRLGLDLQNADNLKHLKHHHRMARAVTAKKERVWDYGVIPYEIDGNFSGLHKALFKQAMRHWENSTCIKFVERDPEIHPNYIVFTVRSCGCCSFVGKRGNGPQAISIGRNCDKFGIVVHELGHVVGFWHEHTRPDREKHVVIELNNIMKGQDYNFNKLTPEEVDSLGLPYDYDSIMHYARNTFSKGTYLDTILPIEIKGKKRPEIGQRLRLSAGDISQANLLYRCPKCGRTFQENTGLFATPSYYTAGALTNETESCEWRITATHGERVVLRLENLNILKSNDCETDYLEVRDGYYFKSPLIGRFCGKVSGDVITSETSRMLLTYVNTHRIDGYRGFKAEYEVICGGELAVDDAEGRLESPNYPLEYLPNKECVWKITVPRGYQVALKFQSFEVENHDSCVYDFVEVRDGASQDAPLIGVFCGYKPPPNMKSSGNSMFVKFVSDMSVQKAGFSAIFMKEVDECETQNHGCEHDCINTLGGYECSCHIGYELHSDKKQCEDACGGVIEYPNGTITSPSFPDMYPVLKECIWEIIAPPKHKISLNFTHFDLEGTTQQQADCGYDSVTIYSKLGENRLKRIGTFCGSAIPPTATSEGNALRVEFRSDKSIQHSGFAAVFFTDIDECSVNNGGCQHECRNTIGSYMCSCHNGYSLHENGHDCKEGECKHEISAPFGTIYSPNFPDMYPPNADCVWHFLTTPGHRIKLIFNEFNVESHQECAYDNVAIYDGESESSSILGRFCGDKIPYPISSSTNQLYMVLKTDKNKQLNGFTAMHSTSCGGYLRATNQIKQFYSHARYGNQNYDENMDCEWTIQAPASSNVQLLFLTFDIESSENCTYDYVQVFSGMEDTSGPMYGQYCGNTLPQDIISMTDSLLVRFKTDNTVTMKGFSASYVAVDPFESSYEDNNSYSSEMVTPFPGSLKSIYKEDDTQESVDYSDFNENHLLVNNPYYYPQIRYLNRV